ncbi:MAG: 2,4-dihydroxyhept-2-ene-1,7-dioic acid aldolase [Candidatus Aminicenantes bacterium]|nr:2,4-dihydroxyhept-2-ene-1,7-dioic acid aldolase [Candidatus Aminicenantes bacterium]
MNSDFQRRLKQGELCIGTFMTLPCPEIAEICAGAGFDWILIDLEHTTLDVKDVQSVLQAVHADCACIVRVPSKDEALIKKVLDTGIAGIVVPHVNTPEEASWIVQHCLYPPEGKRSVGISRAHKYGLRFKEYVAGANSRILVIPQVEHIEGIRRIEDIVRVPGISAVFIGPYDLSGSMGLLGQVKSTEVQVQIDKVRQVCCDVGLPVGIFGIDVDSILPYIEQGFTLIVMGMDSLFLGRSIRSALERVR